MVDSTQYDDWGTTVKTLRPRQNGRRFPDDIFKCIFVNKNVWISIKISLKFVPKGPINNIPALVQIMAWRRPGDKPLSEPMMVSKLTHICVTRPQWVNIRGLDACIYQSPPLPVEHRSMTISVKQCEAGLITEDRVPPVHEVPLSVHSPRHMVAMPMIQSQSGTLGGTPRPIARRLFTMFQTENLLQNWRIISTCRRGAEMKHVSLTIQINCLSSWAVVRLLWPPRLRWCG